jgi:protein ImuA
MTSSRIARQPAESHMPARIRLIDRPPTARLCDRKHNSFKALISSGTLHEFYAARASDAAAMTGLAVGLSLPMAGGRSMLWVRHGAMKAEHGEPYTPGVREMGIDPSQLILLQPRDVISALQAGLEGARCPALGAVLIELRGESRHLDLTASRRLLLAAQRSRTTVFLLRSEAEPRPSAAETRWRVRAAPSLPLATRAPGRPAFDLTLLRRKNGAEGLRFVVEWDRDAGHFEERTAVQPSVTRTGGDSIAGTGASLPGAVVSLTLNRQGADRTPEEPFSKAG